MSFPVDVVLFYATILFVVWLNREKFERQAPLVYILKTKIGLSLMDRISKSHRKLVKFLGYLGAVIAFIGFFFVTYVVARAAFDILAQKPGAIGGSPILPGFEIAGTGLTIPLIIGWLALLIIMVVHEFSHGVVARAHNQHVKSSGIGVLGPIPLAFVELDEEHLAKQPVKVQHSVFAAGPFSNLILGIVCIILLFGVSYAATQIGVQSGVQVDPIQNESLPAYSSGMRPGTIITAIDDKPVSNMTGFYFALEQLSPEQEITVHTKSGESFVLTTGHHPDNSSLPYLGVTNFEQKFLPRQESFFNNLLLGLLIWLADLFWWTQFLSINVGLFNLFPVFVTDGARMLRIQFEKMFKHKKQADKWWVIINYAGLALIIIMLIKFFSNLLAGILNVFIALV